MSSLDQAVGQNDFWSTRDAAQAFTTGSNLSGYRLTGVEFRLAVAGAGSDPDYEVSVHEANADGSPGASIGTLNKPASLATGVNTFSAPGDGFDLEARTTYVVVIDVGTVSGRKNVQTRNTNSNSEDAGAAAGWSIADGGLDRLRVNVDAWTAQSNVRMFAVSGFAKLPSAELVSNIGQADATATSWSTHDHAQGFTTGPSAGGYILTGVDMQLSVTGTGSDPDYSVTIRSSGFDVVGTLVKPSSLATGVNTFRAPGTGIELKAGTTYYVLVDVGEISGRKTVQFANTASPSEDSGKADGWSLSNFGNRRTRTAGANIIPANQTQARKIAVHGYAPTAAPGTPTGVLAGVYGDLTASSFLVSWTAPDFAGTSAITGYDVRYYAGQRPARRRGGLDRARRARRPRPHGQRRPDRAQRARCVHHVPGAGAGRERRWHQRMVGHRRGHHLQRADRHHPGQQPRSARNGDLHHGFIDQQRSRRGIHHRHRSRGLPAERPEPLALGAGP